MGYLPLSDFTKLEFLILNQERRLERSNRIKQLARAAD
jgi:hypothetical protein